MARFSPTFRAKRYTSLLRAAGGSVVFESPTYVEPPAHPQIDGVAYVDLHENAKVMLALAGGSCEPLHIQFAPGAPFTRIPLAWIARARTDLGYCVRCYAAPRKRATCSHDFEPTHAAFCGCRFADGDVLFEESASA